DLAGDVVHDLGRDAERVGAGERLSGQLDHHPVPGPVSLPGPAAGIAVGHPAWPTWNRANAWTVTPLAASTCWIACLGSLTNACSVRTTSLKKAFSRPSTIFGMACSGFPSSRVICS